MKLTISLRDKLPKLTQGAKNHMDRGAWRATVRGVQKVGHDGATKHSPVSVTTFSHS